MTVSAKDVIDKFSALSGDENLQDINILIEKIKEFLEDIASKEVHNDIPIEHIFPSESIVKKLRDETTKILVDTPCVLQTSVDNCTRIRIAIDNNYYLPLSKANLNILAIFYNALIAAYEEKTQLIVDPTKTLYWSTFDRNIALHPYIEILQQAQKELDTTLPTEKTTPLFFSSNKEIKKSLNITLEKLITESKNINPSNASETLCPDTVNEIKKNYEKKIITTLTDLLSKTPNHNNIFIAFLLKIIKFFSPTFTIEKDLNKKNVEEKIRSATQKITSLTPR